MSGNRSIIRFFFNNTINFLALLTCLSQPPIVMAVSANRVFTLYSAVKRAIENSPQEKEAYLSVQMAGMDLKKSRLERFLPKFRLKFNTGLVPEARGDIFSSSDNMDDLDGLGPFYKVDIEMVKPLYAFGRISSAIKASTEGLSIERAKRDAAINDISLNVVKAYWAFSAASRAELISRELRKGFNKILKEVEKRMEDEESEIDYSDYLKVKSSSFAVEERYLESIEQKQLAGKMLCVMLKLDSGEELEISNEPPPVFSLEKKDIERMVNIAEDTSPVMKGINSAIKGLKAKIALYKSDRFPVIFFAAGYRYAFAGNRADQKNPFVKDDFNYRQIGASIGIEWKPDFFGGGVKVQKVKLEYLRAVQKERMLKAKIGIEINQSFINAEKNRDLLKAAQVSLKAARTWLRTSTDNWEMGLGSINRALEAYKTYYRLRGIEIKMENRYNISLAELAHAAGDMNLYLKWIKKGRVSID